MPTFAETDLHISDDELTKIKAGLANTAIADPITSTITEQMAKVDDYTLRYAISDDRYQRLVRALVLFQLYSLLGPVPSNYQKLYDETMQEMRDIRDGKFPDLAVDNPSPVGTTAAKGAYGSADQIQTR